MSARRTFGFVLFAIGTTLLALISGATLSAMAGLGAGLVAAAQNGISSPQEVTDLAMKIAGPETMLGLLLGLIPSALGFVACALLFASATAPKNSEKSLRDRLAIRGARWSDYLLVTAGMVALSSSLGSIVSLFEWNESGTLKLFRDTLLALSPLERAAMLPATALLPSLGEELFFRGFLFNRGSELSSVSVAAATSAFLFGLVHLDPAQGGVALFMGLFLAFSVLKTGSVLPAITAHVANNTLATLAPDFGEEEMTAYVLLGAGALACGLSVVALLRRR